MDNVYRLIELIIVWMNRTILRGYRRWQWDKFTKPVGYVLSPEEYMKLGESWNDKDTISL